MNTNKINILFYLYKNKLNKKNKCPVRCRITFNKQRKQFSTGIFINPSLWDSKQQIAKPPNDENDIINTQLSLIKNKIHQAFLIEPFNIHPNKLVKMKFLSILGISASWH